MKKIKYKKIEILKSYMINKNIKRNGKQEKQKKKKI